MCLTTDKWIKKMFLTHTHTHTMGCYSAIRKKDIMAISAKQMDFESIMLRGISQTKKE